MQALRELDRFTGDSDVWSDVVVALGWKGNEGCEERTAVRVVEE